MFSQDFLGQIRLVIREELQVQQGTANSPQSNEYLNAQEAAEYLKVSKWLLYTLSARGTIPCVLVGKKTKRFLKGDLDLWLKNPQNNMNEDLEAKVERKLEELRNRPTKGKRR